MSHSFLPSPVWYIKMQLLPADFEALISRFIEKLLSLADYYLLNVLSCKWIVDIGGICILDLTFINFVLFCPDSAYLET